MAKVGESEGLATGLRKIRGLIFDLVVEVEYRVVKLLNVGRSVIMGLVTLLSDTVEEIAVTGVNLVFDFFLTVVAQGFTLVNSLLTTVLGEDERV